MERLGLREDGLVSSGAQSKRRMTGKGPSARLPLPVRKRLEERQDRQTSRYASVIVGPSLLIETSHRCSHRCSLGETKRESELVNIACIAIVWWRQQCGNEKSTRLPSPPHRRITALVIIPLLCLLLPLSQGPALTIPMPVFASVKSHSTRHT